MIYMVKDANKVVNAIKTLVKNTTDSTMPTGLFYGTVTSVDPIEIVVDQKLKLTEKHLIFSTLVQDFDVDMYMEHETEKTDLTHTHDASIIITSPHGDTGSITVQNSPDSDNHTHEYTGVKTFTVNLKLAKDEKVILLRIQGGQKFLVVDRVRTLNDTEFSDEFEGEGSSGGSSDSSGDSGSSDSGSSGGNDSSGDNGSTDSGSDDNTDSGDDNIGEDNDNTGSGSNSGVSGGIDTQITPSVLISVLSGLTATQLKEIGLNKAIIDDENCCAETTYSSQKIDSLINNNQGSNDTDKIELNDDLLNLLLPAGKVEYLTFVPNGSWLSNNRRIICDGSEISRTEYPRLFEVIGTTFGEGDGSTTFNLPNLIGRMLYGSSTSATITGGAENITLTTSNLPSHTHSMNHTHNMSHGHGLTYTANIWRYTGSGKPSLNENTTTDYNGQRITLGVKDYSGSTKDSSSSNTGSSGSGTAVNIMNPYHTAVPVIVY